MLILLMEFVAALAAALFAGAALYINVLVPAVLVGAVVPFTFVIIMPTNHRLLAPHRDLSSPETRELLVRWGRLHAVRTLLSLAAAAAYLWLILRR